SAKIDRLPAKQLQMRLVMLYVVGSVVAVSTTMFLVLVGFEFTGYQWSLVIIIIPIVVPFFIFADIYLIIKHFRPVRAVLERFDAGEMPSLEEVSPAVSRALNLPFYSFIRVTFIHGPLASGGTVVALYLQNWLFDAGFETWQIVGFGVTILFFSSPAHAIFEYFNIQRALTPSFLFLWAHCPRLREADRMEVIPINLREKLLYLAIFITALPLFFFAVSIMFKVELLLDSLGVDAPFQQLVPLLTWVVGVVVVCVGGALAMSFLTANDVSSSAARMIRAMEEVEDGRLDNRLFITTTDEYENLYRGFNLMTESLREEVQILEVTQDLAGELNLDTLIERIMTATTELLDAERSTLFVYDAKTDELWSRFAEGMVQTEIRFSAGQGIAGAVFRGGDLLHIPDPYDHPLFNPDIDRQTGFKTRSILCMPIVTKEGDRIGVTQVLNKRGGDFTVKDETRLRAFTAQVAVSLENARLFDDVLNMKNYNESILHSTTNGMITMDTDRVVVTANDAALSILRSEEADVIGRGAEDVFGARNSWLMRSLEAVETTRNNDISVDAELKLASGDSASVNATVSPLIDINQEDIGSMVILEDISSEKRVRTTMARYMSKEVADQLLAAGESELGGKNQHVSILFSDVRGFTTISEALGARETVAMLNEYFEHMVDVVLANGGILDKYIGDAIMALFGAPFAGDNDADNAVTVGNGMLVALRALNVQRAAAGKEAIDIGVGISTGEVIVGNIGSSKRMEYTVIGDSVNLGARLEGANKVYGTKVLLSEATAAELKRDDHLLREIDLIQVQGKDQPVAVFEALDWHTEETFPNMGQTLEAFAAGREAYRAMDWRRAIDRFEAALAANGGDRPMSLSPTLFATHRAVQHGISSGRHHRRRARGQMLGRHAGGDI
ncbi:MAG: adenylate/guanylate cyclase domain-containing protein, partial [Alphaproteobacteria bacterium]